MAAPQKSASSTDQTFDERLSRLEAIVADLEGGGIALEAAIARYQEGVELLKSCRGVLDHYKQRVEELSESAERGLEPYAADPDAATSSGRSASEKA